MPLDDYDFSNGGRRWVSYFDRLGFGRFIAEHHLLEIFCESSFCLREARRHGKDHANVEFAWFSDTVLFWSTDDSRSSFCAVAEVSRWFFDELIDSKVPLRGALAFGEFYGDKAKGLFFGKALVDACQCGEKYDWLGFVKAIESRRDERKHAFVRTISAAPPGLARFVFTPTVKTVGYFLSSRWDLICAARTPPEKTTLTSA